MAEGTLTLKASNIRTQLRKLLHERGNGSLLRAWRSELDSDFSQCVSLEDLQKCANNLGLPGGEAAAKLFFESASSGGVLTLLDLDKKAAVLATRFKRWATGIQPRQVFFESDDVLMRGKVLSLPDFADICRRNGFEASDVEMADVFGFCDISESMDGIRAHDLLFLEPDPVVREQEEQRLKILRMGQREQKQELMAEVFQQDRNRGVSDRHRLAPRPWQARNFEQLPKIVCEKKQDWQLQEERRTEQARAEFLLYLRKSYGNEIRAWRRALDPTATYRLTLTQLRKFFHCEAGLRDCVDQGALWRSLDKDSLGSIGMEDLAPQHCSVLATFRQFMHERCGSCSAVWDHAVALDACVGQREGLWKSTRKLLLQPFIRVLKELGWPTSHADSRSQLLASLDFFGCGFVSRSDLDWLDGWVPPEWIYAEPDEEALSELQKLVRKKYAHPLSAWRSLFDRDDSNSVSWLEFSEACEKLKFKGNLGGAWRALDTDLSGRISLLEFDEDSALILISFKAWAMKHFGSVQLMFRHLDQDGSGSLSYPELRRACRRLKWKGDVQLLFNCLDTDGLRAGGRRNISQQELFFLDSWEVKEEEIRAHEAAHQMQRVAESPASPRSVAETEKEGAEAMPAMSKSNKVSASLPSLMRPPKVDPYPLPPLKLGVSKSTPSLPHGDGKAHGGHGSQKKSKGKAPCKFLQRLLKESGAEGLLK